MKQPVYILDGYGLIYRSYFAFIRQPMRGPKGNNTSAVFGFFRTVLNILRDKKPGTLLVALDSIGPTFRHEMYPEYKANREKTPDDLIEQIPVIEEILNILGIPQMRVNGVEADDIMATIAARCREDKIPCYIVSGDKDLLQMVDDTVKVLRPEKGKLNEYAADEVQAHYDVRPDQILDYLSLLGDAADNVPGVKGIGAKTAVKLLTEYDTLDGIYENVESIKSASQKNKLIDGRDAAYQSRDLIILKEDVELPAVPELPELNYAEAAARFMEEGIRSLALELDAQADVPAVAEIDAALSKKGEYRLVKTTAAFKVMVDTLEDSKLFAFDSETDSLDAMRAKPVGFSFSDECGNGWYCPLVGPGGAVLNEDEIKPVLKRLLENPVNKVILQNGKYDYKVLKNWGVEIANMHFDTMIAAWLCDPTGNRYGMDRLAENKLGYKTIHFDDIVEKGGLFTDVELEKACEYAAEDADITFRLYTVLKDELKNKEVDKVFYEMEMPLLPILANMEIAGIHLDSFALEEYSREVEGRIHTIQKKIFDLVGREFNINSTKQLQEVLFTERQLTPVKKTKTGFSTDNTVLEILAKEDSVPQLVLEYRGLVKLKNTYLDVLPTLVNPKTGRIHTHFNITGTATGRLSSTEPNLQNIPVKNDAGRRIRKSFIPEDGYKFISADYSQIELVVLASLAHEQGLTEAFKSGVDVHAKTASLLFDCDAADVTPQQRRIGKTINFGVMYGMSGFRLSRELDIPRKDADLFIETYFQQYSGIKGFIDSTVEAARKDGFVKTISGRKRWIPNINTKNKTEQMGAERIAVNTPIQGSAADIVKTAMLKLPKVLKDSGLDVTMLLQVHDELIFKVIEADVAAARDLIQNTMEHAIELEVPLKVSVEDALSWGDMH